LFATAVPLFFVFGTAVPAVAQPMRVTVRVGAAASSDLVENDVATPGLRQRLGSGVDGTVRAWAAPGPLVEAGVELRLRPRVRLSGLASWQGSSLQVEDGAGTREVQDLAVLAGLLEAGFLLRGPLEVTAAAGALGYAADETGIFEEGADIAPLGRAGASAALPWRSHAVRVGGFVEAHPFGTAAIRRLGGENGMVMRYGVQAALVWGGAR
jgi:hypothetical protein